MALQGQLDTGSGLKSDAGYFRIEGFQWLASNGFCTYDVASYASADFKDGTPVATKRLSTAAAVDLTKPVLAQLYSDLKGKAAATSEARSRVKAGGKSTEDPHVRQRPSTGDVVALSDNDPGIFGALKDV